MSEPPSRSGFSRDAVCLSRLKSLLQEGRSFAEIALVGHQAMPGGIRHHGVRMSLPLRFFSKWVEWSSARGALKVASLPGPCNMERPWPRHHPGALYASPGLCGVMRYPARGTTPRTG